MEHEEQPRSKANPADHMANERTFLAWIRTSIAIMGFGFVVVKFSLFVKQLSLVITDKVVVPAKGYSPVIGTFLVIVGAVMALLAYLRFRRIEKHLREGSFFPSYRLSLLVTLAILIVSAILIWYLMASS